MTSSTTPLRWPLERILFALSGTMTLLSAALAATLNPWFLLLTHGVTSCRSADTSTKYSERHLIR